MPPFDVSSPQTRPSQHTSTETKIILACTIILSFMTLAWAILCCVFYHRMYNLCRMLKNGNIKAELLEAIDQKLNSVEGISRKIDIVAKEIPRPGLRVQSMERLNAGCVRIIEVGTQTSEAERARGRTPNSKASKAPNAFSFIADNLALPGVERLRAGDWEHEPATLRTPSINFRNERLNPESVEWPLQGDISDVQSSLRSDNSNSSFQSLHLRAGPMAFVSTKQQNLIKHNKGEYQYL